MPTSPLSPQPAPGDGSCRQTCPHSPPVSCNAGRRSCGRDGESRPPGPGGKRAVILVALPYHSSLKCSRRAGNHTHRVRAVNDLDNVFHMDVVLFWVQGHGKAVVLLSSHSLVPDSHHLPIHVQYLQREWGMLRDESGQSDMEQGFPKVGWSFLAGDCRMSGAGGVRVLPRRNGVNQKCSL